MLQIFQFILWAVVLLDVILTALFFSGLKFYQKLWSNMKHSTARFIHIIGTVFTFTIAVLVTFIL
jgi:hypothetical protein